MLGSAYGKVPGHKLADGVESCESGSNGHTGEAMLGDAISTVRRKISKPYRGDTRGVDDALVTESVQQALGDLVSSVVLGNFLSQDEDFVVGLEFLRWTFWSATNFTEEGRRAQTEGFVQGISDGVVFKSGACIANLAEL